MKRRFITWVLLVSMLINCFSVTSFADECKHINKIGHSPVYVYEYEDEDYHILTEIRTHYKCKNCGESYTEIELCYNQRSEHTFQDDDTCYACGYRREEEKHKHKWKLAYAPWYQYVEYNEDYHQLDKIVLDYACKCGATKTDEQLGNGELEKHNFSGDTCYTCGYERGEKKHEHNWKLAYAPWYQYVEYNEDYHQLDKIVLDYACKCGATKTDEQLGNGELEKHNFNGNTCSTCGYVKRFELDYVEENKPEETEKPGEPSSNQENTDNKKDENESTHICKFNEPYQVWIGAYTNINSQTHTQQRVTFAYCVDCGKKNVFSNEPEVVEHTFENGICKWCKYERRVSIPNDDAEYVKEQIIELESLLSTLESLKKRSDFSISEDVFNSIKAKINNFILEYNAMLNGEKPLSRVSNWRNDNDIKLIQSVQDGSYKKDGPPKLVDDIDIVYINLEKPDNKWYYLIADTGEQVIFGNFSEKVTIYGVVGQIAVGEIPGIGTAADIRDITADFVNWKWSWGHVGATALDMIGLIPVVGALKYSDEISGIAAKGVKLSDGANEILTDALKHADDASDVVSKSDEIGDVVKKALTKHADEVGDVTKAVTKNYDDVVKAVKHPEIFSEGALEHIFKGANGGGFHYEGLSDATSKVVEITKFPDANGVYEAMVEIGGKVKKTPSTFFPKDWSPEQVLDAIEQVYINPSEVNEISNAYRGTVNGVVINLYLNSDKRIISAFPYLE